MSVVIPTYGRRDGLAEVLEPLLADPATHEVVVVVDGSPDGSIELLREIAGTDPRLVPIQTPNRGAVHARATGAERATGDIVLLLDDDVVAGPGLVGAHAARHAAEGAGVLVVGYMPLAEDALVSGPARIYAHEYEATCAAYEDGASDAILNGLWAGNFSLPREELLAVAASPSPVVGFHADRDFGLRLADQGLRAVFDRSLRATHRFERTLEGFLADARDGGRTRWHVHQVHRDRIGPLRGDFWESGLPAPGRAVVRLGRRRRGHAAITTLARTGARAGAALGIARLEDLATHVARRIEAQQGAVDAARSATGSA